MVDPKEEQSPSETEDSESLGTTDFSASEKSSNMDQEPVSAEEASSSQESISTVQTETAEQVSEESSSEEPSTPAKDTSEWPSTPEAFDEIFANTQDLEEKVQYSIRYMRAMLAQAGSPNFRNFWHARRQVLPLFKEQINPGSRVKLWKDFSDLSKEARQLKEMFDEQSAFAVEQIDIAIKALEEMLANLEQTAEETPLPELPEVPVALEEASDRYLTIQRNLNLLNTHAARINELRKELIRTDMRVRNKNEFFRRLSAAGDQVFPRRKELIKEISTLFVADVNAFVKEHFGGERIKCPLYQLREEIKGLQSIAKILTLNTHSFTSTRMQLSECWDLVKLAEKEWKKHKAEQKEAFKVNAKEFLDKLSALAESFAKGELVAGKGLKELDLLQKEMRKIDLGRDEVRLLRDEVSKVKQPMLDKIKEEEEARRKEEEERVQQRRELLGNLETKAQVILDEASSLDLDTIKQRREAFFAEVEEAAVLKQDKQKLERALRPLKDIIVDKEEEALLSLSQDDQEALQSHRNVYCSRQNRRKEIKAKVEEYRKLLGASSLDFEKAIEYTERMQEEKDRLDKIDADIASIESEIRALKTKIN